jgi:hypothetical protein
VRGLLVVVASCALAASAACDASLSATDAIYSHGADGPIMCGFNLDNKNSVSLDAIAVGLDRAQVDGTVIHLYTHRPAGTVDASTIESVLAAAADRGMSFVTYRQLVDGTNAPSGLAFSFDDHDIAGWYPLRDIFDRYDAKVTFFISGFTDWLGPEDRVELHQLEAEGHAVEYHSTYHFDAAAYTAANGIDAYVADDILPALTDMRANGFDPKVFAYPFGSRTAETDAALLQLFPMLRASNFACPRGPL